MAAKTKVVDNQTIVDNVHKALVNLEKAIEATDGLDVNIWFPDYDGVTIDVGSVEEVSVTASCSYSSPRE